MLTKNGKYPSVIYKKEEITSITKKNQLFELVIFNKIGTALVYPTLLAAISDLSHPSWRAISLGVYILERYGICYWSNWDRGNR